MTHFFPLSVMGGSLGPGELIVIFAVALMLFGAKRLPSIARTLGKTMETFRKSLREVSTEIMHAESDSHPRELKRKDEPSQEGQPDEHDTAG